jgi:hypothetical protein
MNYQETCKLHGITLTPEQDWACAFLEWHGKRFCVDFGYKNAIELADRHLPFLLSTQKVWVC